MRRNLKTLGPLPLLVSRFVFDIISIVVDDAGEDHQALNREQTPPKWACKLLVPGSMQGKPFLSRSPEKSKDVTEMESCGSTICWRDEGGRTWFNKGDASSVCAICFLWDEGDLETEREKQRRKCEFESLVVALVVPNERSRDSQNSSRNISTCGMANSGCTSSRWSSVRLFEISVVKEMKEAKPRSVLYLSSQHPAITRF